jgi:hypothetical protein
MAEGRAGLVQPAEPTATAAASRWRQPAWLALVGGVSVIHCLVLGAVADNRFDWRSQATMPRRMAVEFVRELAPSAPPPPVAAVRPVAGRRAEAAAPPASAPASEPAAKQPEPPSDAAPAVADASSAADATAQSASAMASSSPASAASAASVASAAASAALAAVAASSPTSAAHSPERGFEWPPSSRLTYQLVGYFRGPVQGHASVEWLHSGGRYQVHLESAVPPLLSRHLASEGTVGEAGLAPQRFDGEQRTLLQALRRWTIAFGPERITLVDGREIPSRPGVQDEASQFVQLTWLFTTQPQLLKVGRSIDIPLVLARRLDTWTYTVRDEQVLTLPGLGPVATFHLVSQRQAPASTDAVPEIWIAPTLQYLPVRILIRQGEETWIDLALDRPPQQSAR